MAQYIPKSVSIKSVIRRASFVRGFTEAKSGKPFDYDYAPADTNDLWAYERGRQFAFTYKGQLKSRNKVLFSAEFAFGKSYLANEII